MFVSSVRMCLFVSCAVSFFKLVSVWAFQCQLSYAVAASTLPRQAIADDNSNTDVQNTSQESEQVTDAKEDSMTHDDDNNNTDTAEDGFRRDPSNNTFQSVYVTVCVCLCARVCARACECACVFW